MKKVTALAAAILLITTSLIAQKGKSKNTGPAIPPFGKVEKSDLEIKECDFDEKAEALVLVDEGQLEFVSDFQFKKRIRIKILSEKGLEWANIHIPFKSEKNEQDINGLEAQTYNLDESGNVVVTKLEKKLVYEKKINKKFTEKVFTFPAVKVGSIIEYKYKHVGYGLSDWYFQRSIPVKYSSFTTDFPEEVRINVISHCAREYEQHSKTEGTRIVNNYTMNDVPGFRDEPYILNEDHYRDHIETKLTSYMINGLMTNRTVTWVQVIRFLMEEEDFGLQIKKNIPRTAELDEKLKTIKLPYEKMKTIYKYVQDNMEWNEFMGIWASEGVRAAWKDKKGTVGEINLILVNLLKDADLDAHPVLVSTHDNGVVNSANAGTYESPGFMQFDKVMAYVEIGDETYVLDASEKTTPAHLIPPDVLLTEGLVIEKIETFEWGWQVLWNEKMKAYNNISIRGVIEETGKMSGEVTIISHDYAKLQRLPIAKKGKDKYIEKYITNENPTMTVDDVVFENLDKDSLPLIQNIKFSQTLNSSGEYKYFSSNILSGLEKNPFIADTRSSDVFFGCNQSYLIIANFVLPDGYELEGLPKNIRMIMPDTSISMSRASQMAGNILMTKVQVEFKKPFYPASQYDEFHEFYKQLFDFLNEQYVLRKKK